ncbi:MAG: hypothetical protein JXR64_10615 [Spirochaetales bacterium]|nr:hypothetical protein [Spirochaetales bacterium]
MILAFIFMLITNSPSPQKIYNSNSAWMILEEKNSHENLEFYIVEVDNQEKWEKYFKFYNDDDLVKECIEVYTPNYTDLITKETKKNKSRNIEEYNNSKLTKIYYYQNDELESVDIYMYNSTKELINISKFDSEDELISQISYFRNIDGTLRKVVQKELDEYINQIFYRDGTVYESWLTEDSTLTRRIYRDDGLPQKVIIYKDNKIISNKEFEYDSNGKLLTQTLVKNSETEISYFNDSENITELRILGNGILLKKSLYEYRDNLLVLETITGHGKKEEFYYEYNEENKITSINEYINGILKKIHYFIDDDTEVYEYYKDNTIYLKENFYQGEKISRDIYLDGKLFNSEKIVE